MSIYSSFIHCKIEFTLKKQKNSKETNFTAFTATFAGRER